MFDRIGRRHSDITPWAWALQVTYTRGRGRGLNLPSPTCLGANLFWGVCSGLLEEGYIDYVGVMEWWQCIVARLCFRAYRVVSMCIGYVLFQGLWSGVNVH